MTETYVSGVCARHGHYVGFGCPECSKAGISYVSNVYPDNGYVYNATGWCAVHGQWYRYDGGSTCPYCMFPTYPTPLPYPWPPVVAPVTVTPHEGCICPPMSNLYCENPKCPRKSPLPPTNS